MAEDWRIHVVLQDSGGRGPWSADRLEARELAEVVRGELGGRVAVSRDDGELFLYADSKETARAVARVVRADLDEHGWTGQVELARWHDDAEEWKSPDVPLPVTDAERAAERAELLAEEDAETAAEGYAAGIRGAQRATAASQRSPRASTRASAIALTRAPWSRSF